MKKYPGRAALSVLLAALFVLSCAGCSRADSEPDSAPAAPPEETPVVGMSQDPPAMNTWQALEFTLNDTPLQLPLTLDQLQELGFEMAAYEGETFRELVPGEQTEFYMTHPDCGPYHVLEGVLTNPDGGDTPVEQWPVQAITFTLMPQLENAGELVAPQAELVNGIRLGCGMQEVFDNYGVYSEIVGPEEGSGWWTVRYNQDNLRRMNFLFAEVDVEMDGLAEDDQVWSVPYLVAMQLMLTPES